MQHSLLLRSAVIAGWVICGLLPRVSAAEGGYASKASVAQGEAIDLHISTAASTYSISIYREGAPRMLMAAVGGLRGIEYDCPEPRYATGCGWPASYRLDIPYEWQSGVYMAEFDAVTSERRTLYIPFVVREDEPGTTSPIVVSIASNTHQAYNNFGGKSLYNFNSSSSDPARIVSYDRPYKEPGDGSYFEREHPFVAWAEKLGYPMEFVTNVDLHADPGLLTHYKCFVCLGHDEYWTREMRDHLDAFTRSGGNAMILSGDTCWWQVRLSSDLRTLYGYKGFATLEDPLATDLDPTNDHLVTTNWFLPPINYPENSTIGLSRRHGGAHDYEGQFLAADGFGGYKVYRTSHWVFGGTGLADGQTMGQAATIVGYEVDGTLIEARDSTGNLAWDSNVHYPLSGALPFVVRTDESKTPANFTVLGVAPASRGHAVMGIFETPIGGRIFNAGTIDWVDGLGADAAVSRVTMNVLNSFSGHDPGANEGPTALIFEAPPLQVVQGATVAGRGEGTDADGVIAEHRWRSSLNGLLSFDPIFSTASLGPGAHTLYFAVRDDRGRWSKEAQASVEVMPRDDDLIIADDGQPEASPAGSWVLSHAPHSHGGQALYTREPGASFAYNVSLPGGAHDLGLWWTEFPSRHERIPVEVSHAQGTSTVYVDQRTSGGKWNFMGRWTFGASARVTIRSPGVATTCADAVCFSPASGQNRAPLALIALVFPNPATGGKQLWIQGRGMDRDGSVAGHEWRSSIDGVISNAAAFTSTVLTPGPHTLYFRVRDNQGAWSRDAAAQLLMATGEASDPIILDDGGLGTSSTGAWQQSNGSRSYGATSVFSKAAGATYTFHPTIEQDGLHDIYLWWTTAASRLTAVPVDINHAAGTQRLTVNQRENAGQWNRVGSWRFTSSATIQIQSPGGGSACADAILLIRTGP